VSLTIIWTDTSPAESGGMGFEVQFPSVHVHEVSTLLIRRFLDPSLKILKMCWSVSPKFFCPKSILLSENEIDFVGFSLQQIGTRSSREKAWRANAFR